MRTVIRTLLTAGAMLISVVAADAQAPDPRPAVLITEARVSGILGTAGSPVVVLERLISFDADADRRISRDELPERMQGLVARGDTNADAALDPDEIRALVKAASSERVRRSFRPPSSEGLAGVISDLKLPPEKHERALGIVSTHKPPREANDPQSSALLAAMKDLLDEEEYESFLAAATRLSRSADFRFRTPTGMIRAVPPPPRPR